MNKIIGIVAEYNPFHNGHLYQIKKIREKYKDATIVVVSSSSFTQRGEISLLNKFDKTKVALNNGVDLVIELPFVYATQSSDIFAKGAIEILNNLKIDTLIFGTERDNIKDLELVADIQINNKEYQKKVKEYLVKGSNYATATNKALEDITNIKGDTPNDLLALSYIKQIKELNIDEFRKEESFDKIGIGGHSQGGLGAINAVTAQDNGHRYKAMYAASAPTLQISVDLLKAPLDVSGINIPCFMNCNQS